MAHHKSALKRIRQNEKRRLQNRYYKKTARTAIKNLRELKDQEEAKAFLAWLASPEGAALASEQLPTGFYPMINAPITLSDPHANEFLALNTGKETDARFVWPKMMDLYAPMNQEVIKVLKGETTPQAAADALAALKP